VGNWWTERIAAGGLGAPAQAPPPAYPPPPPGYPPPPNYPPPPVQPPPPYYPPPQPPQQPPPPYYAPVPGAPAHAPFGFDPATGAPLAPYGYDQFGRMVMQPPQAYVAPPYAPPQPGYQQPPAYAPNGLPYAAPAPSAPAQGWVPDGRGGWEPGQPPTTDGIHVHYMDAAAHFKGREGIKQVTECPNCGGPLVPRNEGGQNNIMNLNSGIIATPAPECATCGYNGKFEQMGSGRGVEGIQVVGSPRLAPGAGSLHQVAHQHNMKNLFAPKER
jgi:hypothetical protein